MIVSPGEETSDSIVVGGLSTEVADATRAVPHWDVVQERISKSRKHLDNKFI